MKSLNSVDAAVVKANSAFHAAKQADRQTRAAWLKAVGAALEEHRDELVPLAMSESHLPEARLKGELTRTIFQLNLLATEAERGEFLDATIDHADPEWGMGPRPDLRRINVPMGVIGVFGASNFPFAFSVIGGDSAAALAGGNAVVHKIHSAHRELGWKTAEIVKSALSAAGAPDGLFETIEGREEGTELVKHPLVKAVGFTGSVGGGRALYDVAASRPNPIPFYGELGSLNPVVVTERAWDERGSDILAGFAGSVTTGVGQFCTKPGLVFAPLAAEETVNAELPDLLAQQALGPGMLTEGIRDSFLSAFESVKSVDNVETVVGAGTQNPPSPGLLQIKAADVEAARQVLETEMFGPAAVIIYYASQAELLQVLELLEGQLTGTLQTVDGENPAEVISILTEKCGRLLRNGWPTGVTVSYAQNHGGPYPSSTIQSTSVGTAAVGRFLRPVAFQDFEQADLPVELQDGNPAKIYRRVDGEWTID